MSSPLNDRTIRHLEESMKKETLHKLCCRGLSWLVLGLCLATLVSLSAVPGKAQSTSTGTVTGLVSDQQNAVVPGADVSLTDVATGTSRKTTTNDVGRYTFVNVAPGTYDLTVSRTGFQRAVVGGQI